MKIQHSVQATHSGQSDEILYVERNGHKIAYLEYSVFEDQPHINMIEVEPEYRRAGLGRDLVVALQKRFPDAQINWGWMTQDGEALKNSLRHAVILDPMVARNRALRARVGDKLAALHSRFDQGDKTILDHGEHMNRLHDIAYRLDRHLETTPASKSIVQEMAYAPLYHAFGGSKIKYAELALRTNRLVGNTTQRFWADGKRRKENAEDYKQSFWMKGVSFTRSLDFAKNWGSVIFAVDQTKLRQKVKLIPFAWNYHFDPKSIPLPDHKKEQEEFAVLKATPDNYMKAPEDEYDIEKFDFDRWQSPEGEISNLDSLLVGIFINRAMYEKFGPERRDDLEFFIHHPKFKGFV